jgi:SAM-dependent methyltransferase
VLIGDVAHRGIIGVSMRRPAIRGSKAANHADVAPARSRNERLLQPLRRHMRILELGASHAPLTPKRDGWNTVVVDHASRAELVAKYEGHAGVDTGRIEDVDVVWTSGRLHDALPPNEHGSFDAILASHVIEHVPDLLGLLESFERLLHPGGVVVLAVPDKRRSFDFFKPLSTTGDVLEAHERQAERHSRKTRFDDAAYSVSSRGEICWGARPADELTFFSTLEQAKAIFETPGVGREDPYVDCHGWRFTPSSFALALLELRALGEIGLTAEVEAAPGCEFLAFLRAEGIAPTDIDAERLRLLRQTVSELAEQTPALATAPLTRRLAHTWHRARTLVRRD